MLVIYAGRSIKKKKKPKKFLLITQKKKKNQFQHKDPGTRIMMMTDVEHFYKSSNGSFFIT